jgi:hypothetical protein
VITRVGNIEIARVIIEHIARLVQRGVKSRATIARSPPAAVASHRLNLARRCHLPHFVLPIISQPIAAVNEEQSFIAAYDKNTGDQLWYTPQEGLGSPKIKSGWSTPFVWENEVRTEVVTHGPGWVISYDLNGAELWRMSRLSNMAIQSPFAYDGLLYENGDIFLTISCNLPVGSDGRGSSKRIP